MDGKFLGKIVHADVYTEYGHLYFSVELSGNGIGVSNHYPLIPGPKAKEASEWKIFPLAEVMQKAKVEWVKDLKNKPVEIVLERNILKDWRILEEVL